MAALTKLGWVAYAVAFLASHAGLEPLFVVALILGMACHWRFWRWALPLGLIAFCFGYWRGTRKVAERRRRSCPSS